MLRSVLASAALAVPVALLAVPASASPTCAETDPLTGVCVIWVDGGGDTGGGGGGGDTGGGGGGGDTGGGDGGSSSPVIVVDGQNCLYVGLADPQPHKSDPVWEGNEDGAIHTCTTDPGGGSGSGSVGGGPAVLLYFWAASAPTPPPPPDPEDLARDAIASMNLRAIDIGIVPEDTAGSIGLVGLPTWMWAQNPGQQTMGPITRTASARGYSVTATATVERVVWTLGDGTTVTCEGPGTPYANEYGKQESPDCGHTYIRQGRYDVAATSYWTVAWAGIGETGVIPLDFTNTTAITVGESQVITN